MREISLSIPILAALLLSGCSLLPTRTVATVNCPALKQYDAAFQTEAARELRAIAQTAPNVVQLVTDYAGERERIRGCATPQP